MFKNLNPMALGVSGHQSEIIELALSYGFSGIDLNIVEFSARVKLKGMEYAQRLINSARIRIGSFPLPMEIDSDEESFDSGLRKLPKYAEDAAHVGCKRCTVVLSPASDRRPYHENFEFHRQRLRAVCDALQPAGVRLAVGFQAPEYLRRNHAFQFLHDFDALTLLLNMVGASNIGVLLDVWDLTVAGGSIDTLRKLPVEQILVVQLADLPAGVSPAELDEKSRLLPGEENMQINLPGFLAALREMGYDGPVSVKPSRSVFTNRRRDLIVKQAGEALDKVWHAAGLPAATRLVLIGK